MARRPRNKGVAVDTSLLDQKEISAIRAKAREAADKERKQRQEDDLYEAELEEARKVGDPDEVLYAVHLNLAPHASTIRLDNRVFFHGQVVHVNLHQKCALKDIIARGWEHEEEVGGVNRDRYRPSRGVSISPHGITAAGGAIVTTAQRLGGGI